MYIWARLCGALIAYNSSSNLMHLYNTGTFPAFHLHHILASKLFLNSFQPFYNVSDVPEQVPPCTRHGKREEEIKKKGRIGPIADINWQLHAHDDTHPPMTRASVSISSRSKPRTMSNPTLRSLTLDKKALMHTYSAKSRFAKHL